MYGRFRVCAPSATRRACDCHARESFAASASSAASSRTRASLWSFARRYALSCATIARSLSPLCRAVRRARAKSVGASATDASPNRGASVCGARRATFAATRLESLETRVSVTSVVSVCVCASDTAVTRSRVARRTPEPRSGAGVVLELGGSRSEVFASVVVAPVTDVVSVARASASASAFVFVSVPVPVPVPVSSQRGGRGIPGSADAAARSWNAARSRCSAAEARRSADSARADACSS